MTYGELLAQLYELSPKQLKEEVQAYSGTIDEAVAVSLAFNSKEQMGTPLEYIGKDMPILLLDD